LLSSVFALLSCSGEKDSKDPVPNPKPLLQPASCLVLNNRGTKNGGEANQKAFVLSCFDSKDQLSVEWCEKNASFFDTDKRFYQLFKGETKCPTDNLKGTCRYSDTVVHFYSHKDIDTDFALIEKGCTEDKGTFTAL
jgi:hypothetical protein